MCGSFQRLCFSYNVSPEELVVSLTVAGMADVYVLLCFGPPVTTPALDPRAAKAAAKCLSSPALLITGLGAEGEPGPALAGVSSVRCFLFPVS